MSDSYHSESSDSSEGGDVGGNVGAGVGEVAAPAGNNNTQNTRTDRQWRLMNTATMRILGKVSSQILSLNSSYNLLVPQRPN